LSSPFKEIPWVIINDKINVQSVSNKIRKNNACVYSVCFWTKQNFEGFFSSITQLFNILLRRTLGYYTGYVEEKREEGVVSEI